MIFVSSLILRTRWVELSSVMVFPRLRKVEGLVRDETCPASRLVLNSTPWREVAIR